MYVDPLHRVGMEGMGCPGFWVAGSRVFDLFMSFNFEGFHASLELSVVRLMI